MSFQKRFRGWQERMQNKSEEERHNYALTVSIILGAIITFFVISGWYFRLTGGSIETGIFSEFESFYSEQKQTINKLFDI